MMLDTGAGMSVVAGWLVRSLGMPTVPIAGDVRDSLGQQVDVRLVRNADISITGIGAITERDLIVVELPPFFEAGNVGVILSPQQLGSMNEAVLLDLQRDQLSLVPAFETFQQSASLGRQDLTRPWVRACGSAVSLLSNVKFVLPAQVDGAAALLELDTGASTTRIRTSSAAGQVLAAHTNSAALVAGVASSDEGAIVHNIEVRMGDVVETTDITLMPAEEEPVCPSDGLLGMDVLRRCTLLLSRLQAVVRCGT